MTNTNNNRKKNKKNLIFGVNKSVKKSAFTLAEVMILLLTLSILLAAFAPVFTRRYSSGGVDEVWSYVPADNQGDAYFDDTDKTHRAQAFIGMSPHSDQEVIAMSGGGDAETFYPAKLIIAANYNQPRHSSRRQNQIQFRYNNQEVGGLLATKGESVLVGGNYSGVNSTTALRNTSFGVDALSTLTTGDDNTAIGYYALNLLTTGSKNTVIGSYAGAAITSGNANTIIGYNTGNGLDVNSFNTLIGYNIGIRGNANTIIGNDTATAMNGTANYNTFIGNHVGLKFKNGSGNTVVGHNSFHGVVSGKTYDYNTIIGANAGSAINNSDDTKYKTCIGANSCNDGYSSFLTDDKERVFIGGHPTGQPTGSGADSPIATLEVHNVPGTISKSAPLEKVGNPTVLINGNLIVRGQTYLEIPIYRTYTILRSAYHVTSDNKIKLDRIPKGLVLFTYFPNNRIFAGYDGMKRSAASYERCRQSEDKGWFNPEIKRHAFNDIRYNCICTSNALHTAYKYPYNTDGYPSISYDWVSAYNRMSGGSPNRNGITSASDADTYANIGGNSDGSPSNRVGYNSSLMYVTTSKDNPHANHIDEFAWYGMWTEADPYANSGTFYNIRKAYARSWYIDQTRPTAYNAQKVIHQRNTGKGGGAYMKRGWYPNANDDSYKYKYFNYNVSANVVGTDKIGDMFNLGTDYNFAHQYYNESCCPNLTGYKEGAMYYSSEPGIGVGNAISGQVFTSSAGVTDYSDARLKNIGEKFSAGLDEIKKLNIYNYTFKADINKLPQVGVIAQDLKLVFPNAVTKDENGYYKIRWDEMFYAAVNAIKTLNAKVSDLAAKVDNYNKRVQQLKADNKQLNAQLDKLSAEVEKLQSKK